MLFSNNQDYELLIIVRTKELSADLRYLNNLYYFINLKVMETILDYTRMIELWRLGNILYEILTQGKIFFFVIFNNILNF